MLNKNAVTKSYNKMIKQQQHQLDAMTNLGKSRDLKVEKSIENIKPRLTILSGNKKQQHYKLRLHNDT